MELTEILQDDGVKKKKNPTMLIVLTSVVGGLGVTLTALSLPFVVPFFRRVCLPYVPATTQQVENVLEALKGRSGNLVDLGSGDGRIVIAAAQKGFYSVGVELNTCLILYSRMSALYHGLQNKVKFYQRDLWKFSLKPYENVVIFGVDSMMDELEQKFMKELNPNSCIVACRFPLSNLTPVKTVGEGIDTVWVYQIK